MTTIGYATLAIIPSLKGVSEAITKQIGDKPFEVTVEPTVDKRAAEKVGKSTGEAVTKAAKDEIKKGDLGRTVNDSITDSVKRGSPGKDLAKVIVDGVADGAKSELRKGGRGGLSEVFVDGLADGVKQGIDSGAGGKIADAITGGIKSQNLGGKIKDAVLPGITQIGTDIKGSAATWAGGIAAALKSGDIEGATNDIATTVLNTTDLIAGIGDTFGLQTEGVRSFADSAVSNISKVSGNVQSVIDTINLIPGASDLAEKGMSKAFEKIGPKLSSSLSSAGLVGGAAGWALPITMSVVGVVGVVEALKNFEANWGTPELNEKLKDSPAVRRFGKQVLPQIDPSKMSPEEQRDWLSKALKGQGHSAGGYTGAFPIDKIAGVVHGDEHVIKATSRRSIENAFPGLLDYMNNTGRLPGYENGGLVDAAKRFAISLDPAKYLMGGFSPTAIDCSGFVSAVANVATGRPPFQSRMSTVTEGSWLKSLGFQSGRGKSGDLRVGWWDKGGGANGHTAGTFPDGTNFESNGSQGVVIGGKTGADSGQFTQHAFLPVSKVSGSDILAGLGVDTAGSSAAPEAASSSRTAPASSGGGGITGGSVPSSLSGLSTFGLNGLGVTTKVNEDSPERKFDIGGAAGSAISGQVSSALGVLGVPDSPGWLQGISKFVSGISVSDSSGKKIFDGSNLFGGGGGQGVGNLFGGAAPAAATPTVRGAAPVPDTTHGGTGAQPGNSGPVFQTNISAFDTTDAINLWERKKNEIVAAKTSRY